MEIVDRPLGWRPLSNEQKAAYREAGMSEEFIAEREAENRYQPVDSAIMALHLGVALLKVGTRRFGADFATEVRTELFNTIDRLSKSEDTDDHVEAPIVRDLVDGIAWDSIIAPTPSAAAADSKT